MKTVLSPDMVPHVWANQSQPHGKTSHGNFYFRGASLFSYGAHYLCGLIMPDGAALINADKHSKTTSKHQSAAWSAASHRTRYQVPGLTTLATVLQNYADAEKGSEWKTREAARVRKYVAENIGDLTSSGAEYLLAHVGFKNAEKLAARLLADSIRATVKENADKKAATKKERLAYASHVSKLCKNEKELIAGLANVFAKGTECVAGNATFLRHVHKAAKDAKREKQAADVWRVLSLVRAEIKRREDSEARKNANAHLRNNIREIRQTLDQVSRGVVLTAWSARTMSEACGNVIAFPRVARAVPALTALRDGFAEIHEPLLAQEEAEREEKKAREMSDWLNGVSSRAPYSNGATLLRALNVTRDHTPQCAVMFAVESADHGPCNCHGAITGGTLQTSRGADVPLLHAIRAFRFIKLLRERNAVQMRADEKMGYDPIDVIAWERNGHSVRVGHFAIDTIWQSGNFRAGCHTILWREVERLALSLGVADIAATDDALEVTSHAA